MSDLLFLIVRSSYKMNKHLLCVVFVFAALSSSSAQTFELKGIVKAKQSGTPIPYASIILADKPSGTYTNEDGSFRLNVTSGQALNFSALGYTKVTLTASQIKSMNYVITLEEDPTQLSAITVTAGKTKGKSKVESFGYHKAQKKSRLSAKTPGFQPATLIENPRKTIGHVESIILNVVSGGKSRIRLHLYVAENFPHEQKKLLPVNLLVDIGLMQGLKKVDVSKYGIEFPEEGLIVGVEFIGNVKNGKVEIANGIEIETKLFLSKGDRERNTWIGFMGNKFEREPYSITGNTNSNAMVGLEVRFFDEE